MLDGRRVLLLGTNNYLGLTFDRDCIAAAVAATEAEGTGTTGSRIANGSYGGHEALERRLAAFLGRRSAMVFTTGYQANLGVLSALAGRGDHLLLDADSHASIYDGARLAGAQVTRFRHNDPDDLRRRLRVLSSQPGDKLIVVEGIYSMLGDTAPLREIAAVKRETGAWLLVDEAHSLGVLGARGRGLAEAEGVEADVDFVVGTFSKSLGAIGGYLRLRPAGFRRAADHLARLHVHRVAAAFHRRLGGAGDRGDGAAAGTAGAAGGERPAPACGPRRRGLPARRRAGADPVAADAGPGGGDRVLERAAGGRRVHQPRSRVGDAGRPAALAHERQRGAQRGADRLRGRRDRARREGVGAA